MEPPAVNALTLDEAALLDPVLDEAAKQVLARWPKAVPRPRSVRVEVRYGEDAASAEAKGG